MISPGAGVRARRPARRWEGHQQPSLPPAVSWTGGGASTEFKPLATRAPERPRRRAHAATGRSAQRVPAPRTRGACTTADVPRRQSCRCRAPPARLCPRLLGLGHTASRGPQGAGADGCATGPRSVHVLPPPPRAQTPPSLSLPRWRPRVLGLTLQETENSSSPGDRGGALTTGPTYCSTERVAT